MSVKMTPKNFVDLTGQTFGFLTVKERYGETVSGNATWLCECRCGNTKVVAAKDLRNNHVRSCGCAKPGELQSKGELVEGYRFGMLVAQRIVGYTKKHSPIWECLCECGNSTHVSYNDLRHGRVKSCGCTPNNMVPKTNLVDLTGRTFERLKVLKRNGTSKDGHVMWECVCVCGNKVTVKGKELVAGHVRSCGCLSHDILIKRNYKHGLSKNCALYGIWSNMRGRCNRSSHSDYYLYGARGISVCSEWNDYSTFYEWSMENGYSEGLSIERIDVNGNYEPSNCKWITMAEQARNKRNTVKIVFNGDVRPLIEVCEEIGFNYRTADDRRRRGWEDKDLFAPVKKKKLN